MMPLDANSSALQAFLAPHGWGLELARCRGCGPDKPGNAVAELIAKALAGLRAIAGSYVWAAGFMRSAFWTNAALLAPAGGACFAARRAQDWLATAVAGLGGRQHGHAKHSDVVLCETAGTHTLVRRNHAFSYVDIK